MSVRSLFLLPFLCWGVAINGHSQNLHLEIGFNLTGGTNIGFYMKPQPSTWKQVPQYQYAIGAFGRRFFKEHYGLEIGLQYSAFGLKEKRDGYLKPETHVQSYEFIEIPLHFIYKRPLKKNKLELGGMVGLSPTFCARGKERYSFTPKSWMSPSPFNLLVDVGFLFRANVVSHLFIETKPMMRIATLALQSDGTWEKMVSAGLSLGTVWQF